ncbi:MAG: pantetheine-phosphate adenylyltransferase [Gammaproteobacteria bacterium]|nr:pantetheine-phosphate adenylyltransferase [Gammaproteobacteria bacterium]
MKNLTAIYPGTFDPITNGHIDLLSRAAKMFDRVVLAVAESPAKKPVFSLQERLAFVEQMLLDYPSVSVLGFSGLLVDFAEQQQAAVIIRGLRAVSDFEYEVQLAGMNRRLNPDVETVFISAAQEYAFVSSSLVREIAFLGGDVSDFVPLCVKAALQQRIG